MNAMKVLAQFSDVHMIVCWFNAEGKACRDFFFTAAYAMATGYSECSDVHACWEVGECAARFIEKLLVWNKAEIVCTDMGGNILWIREA